MKDVQENMGRMFLEQHINEDSEEKLSFKITRCLFAEAYNELGLSDLGYATCCHVDYAIAENWHPNGRLTREHTLMKGGPYCDLTYTWEES